MEPPALTPAERLDYLARLHAELDAAMHSDDSLLAGLMSSAVAVGAAAVAVGVATVTENLTLHPLLLLALPAPACSPLAWATMILTRMRARADQVEELEREFLRLSPRAPGDENDALIPPMRYLTSPIAGGVGTRRGLPSTPLRLSLALLNAVGPIVNGMGLLVLVALVAVTSRREGNWWMILVAGVYGPMLAAVAIVAYRGIFHSMYPTLRGMALSRLDRDLRE